MDLSIRKIQAQTPFLEIIFKGGLIGGLAYLLYHYGLSAISQQGL
jgi:hypothetical protein